MKEAIHIAIALAIFVAWIGALATMDNKTIKYDCRLAEISPDFPPAVKEQCRKLMERK